MQVHRLVGLLMTALPECDYPAFLAYLADATRDPWLATIGRRILAYGFEVQEQIGRLHRDLGTIDSAKNHWHAQAEAARAEAEQWQQAAATLQAEAASYRSHSGVPEMMLRRMRTTWAYRLAAKAYSRYYRSS